MDAKSVHVGASSSVGFNDEHEGRRRGSNPREHVVASIEGLRRAHATAYGHDSVAFGSCFSVAARRGRRSIGVLDAARAGRAGALVLRGEAGIGKTALLDDAVATASDLTVIRVVGVESEMGMAFAALHRLLVSFLPAVDQLPEPQREALESAFGLRSDGGGDVFLVGLAALTLLGDAARERPLLCIVDDAQWLDRESINVLAFVARRVYADQIALLFAVREPSEPAVPHRRGRETSTSRGLDDGDARELLSSVVGGPLGPPLADRIVSETRGNPLALIELGGELSSDHLAGAPITEPLPVSELRRGPVPAASSCVAARHTDAPARRRCGRRR